jgi:hypothetical protein
LGWALTSLPKEDRLPQEQSPFRRYNVIHRSWVPHFVTHESQLQVSLSKDFKRSLRDLLKGCEVLDEEEVDIVIEEEVVSFTRTESDDAKFWKGHEKNMKVQ